MRAASEAARRPSDLQFSSELDEDEQRKRRWEVGIRRISVLHSPVRTPCGVARAYRVEADIKTSAMGGAFGGAALSSRCTADRHGDHRIAGIRVDVFGLVPIS